MSRTFFAYSLLFLAALSRSAAARTAVLFGATGEVGNEVLRALLERNAFFTKLVLVGRRRFPAKVTDLLPDPASGRLPEVVTIEVPDIGGVDRHGGLLAAGTADACFIATGAGRPYLLTLAEFHRVEIDMTAAMTRLCGKIGARTVTAFTAVDAPASPDAYAEGELGAGGDGAAPLGWLGMLWHVMAVYGLKERAVVSNAASGAAVRIFQPSNIVTKEIRYGWLDWALFRIQPWIDPYVPARYHSVEAALLGEAMVGDAVGLLAAGGDGPPGGTTRLTYGDFVRIAAAADSESSGPAGETHAEL